MCSMSSTGAGEDECSRISLMAHLGTNYGLIPGYCGQKGGRMSIAKAWQCAAGRPFFEFSAEDADNQEIFLSSFQILISLNLS